MAPTASSPRRSPRRLAKEAGIDLARIQGSGPHGRVIARDVEAAKSGKGLVAPAPRRRRAGSRRRRSAPSDDKIRALFEPGSYEVVPHDNIRKVIARRLVEAKLTIPHFYLTLDCNIGKLLAAREEINAAAPKDKDGKPAYKISVNDFVIKALALALQRIPDANVTWTEGGMLKHKHSDIGVAVAIPGGLITPIVRKAETEIAVGHLQRDEGLCRARARAQAQARGVPGRHAARCPTSACTASRISTAVINPPHATILAVGAGEERAVVRNGKIEAAHVMTVDALDRPSRGRRRARRRAARRVQGADRKSGDDGGVRHRSADARCNDETTGSDGDGQEIGRRST